ncbi:SAM-dependent methyltransferase [Pedobacter sp. SD-b]|uniref:SAM-dependent methyltransferase n=1 Tax=Pedobacter segetis TaxID=2793069 RepID=A0ABS1BNE2_9SPHI|nr:SAM-dependent methyltransferase [Pedobacter segetis]MBK0383831.1 SAM-dependent methyltransferase [Pedobacter segetis]
MEKLDSNYWNDRYINQQTIWDLGEISSPIKTYIDQLKNKDLSILIPGAGNAYEALYLLDKGFSNVTGIDFAVLPLQNLKLKLKDIEKAHYHLINDDFFNHRGTYDLILEQTFFCAINPKLRLDYVNHCHQLLNNNGKIAGLLFNKNFGSEGPPFGGNEIEYRELFKNKFEIKIMEVAYNSITPRQGSELFVIFCSDNPRVIL